MIRPHPLKASQKTCRHYLTERSRKIHLSVMTPRGIWQTSSWRCSTGKPFLQVHYISQKWRARRRKQVKKVNLPVKVASSGVDLATTSQSEADQARGREIRQREERLGRLRRDYERQIDNCGEGDRRACDQARLTYAEMQVLLPSIPAEPD